METSDGIALRDFALENLPQQREDDTLQPQPGHHTSWYKTVRITISEAECRDHFALERTFLAYVRTASAYAQFGVTVAQLFRLNTTQQGIGLPPSLKIGTAVGATTEGVAILIILAGATYFMKQQHRLEQGTILSRGWEISTIVVMSFAVSQQYLVYSWTVKVHSTEP